GKIYVADYNGPTVAALDLGTGKYTPIQPVIAQQVLTYTHPGDIKIGPDKLLYLLNNGNGPQGMYIMKPDGQVVRQVPLNGKSNVAIGLSFGPDGKMYVADMINSQIYKYNLAGGEPLSGWTGRKGGFNNVGGVAVDQ